MTNLDAGQWTWVSDPTDYKVPAQVLEFRRGQSAKVKLQDDTIRDLSAEETQSLFALDPQCLDENVDNLVGLSNLTEEAILHNLRIRFNRDNIYTCISSILIAVNPFRQLPLYTVEILQHYATCRDKASLPPHVFSVADRAFQNMLRESTCQSVVISGESGAGKTESTKLILQYLAEVSGAINAEDSIEQQILQANPLMEAFGNAKTVRNNNSSRFGKLITVYFNNGGEIIGGSVINYLLEKSRVVSVQPSERNYHVFYQLLAAVEQDRELKAQLMLDYDTYHYIHQSSITTIEGVSDLEEFHGVIRAMEVLGIDSETQLNVWKSVAGILHLGNVVMEAVTRDLSDDCARVGNREVLDKACQLLGLRVGDLEQNLTSRNIGNHSVIVVAYTREQAIDARDALCRMIYSKLFDWLIACINDSLVGRRQERKQFIAVLDIFGFESFETNSFEQLCINYCNEKLQYHFNHHIFSMEQQQYAAEGIPVEAIGFEDNQPTLELLEAKGTGVFALVDEETNVPKGSDEGFLNKCLNAHSKHPRFERARPKLHKNSTSCFVIKHYAGDVAYNVQGFLDKDRDAIHPTLQHMVTQSANPFVARMMGAGKVAQDAAPEEEPAPRAKSTRRTVQKRTQATLAMQFKQQLHDLMNTLNSTEPHFVRCMKPNTLKVGKKFDSHLMLAQLRYAGLVEVCRIRQLGYPLRKPHDKFMQQYGFLEPAASNIEALLKALCDRGILRNGLWVNGRTQMFMKQEQSNVLDAERDKAFYEKALTVQKFIRGWSCRSKMRVYRRILGDLKEGLRTRNQTKVQDALQMTTELPFAGAQLAVVKEAKNLLQRLLEEQRVEALISEAIVERALAPLQSALKIAAQMAPPLESEIVHRARQLVERVAAEKAHLNEAAPLLSTRDKVMLHGWLAHADELELNNSDEYRAIRALVDRIGEEEKLLETLLEAVEQENLRMLTAYLSKAAEMGMAEHPQVAQAKQKRDALQQRMAALTALGIAMHSKSADTIAAAIEKAEKANVRPDLDALVQARRELQILLEAERLERGLTAAIDSRDPQQLEVAIQQASQKLLEISEHSAMDAVKAALSQAQRTAQSMREQAAALEVLQRALGNPTDVNWLQEAVTAALQVRLVAPEIKTAQQILAQSSRKSELKGKLDTAIEAEDLPALEAIISDAESLGLHGPEIESAKAARARLAEELRIVNDLRDAIIAADMRRTGAMLVQLKALGLRAKYPDLVEDAELMVSALKGKFEAEMSLRSAVQARELQPLQAAVIKAQESGVSAEMLAAATNLLDTLAREADALAALRTATTANDSEAMRKALEVCQALNINDHLVQQSKIILERAATVGQVETLLEAAEDASILNDALERAIQLGITGERVETAKLRLKAMTGLSDLLVNLRSAVKTLTVHAAAHAGLADVDIVGLRHAIEEYLAAGGERDNADLQTATTKLEVAQQQLDIQQELAIATASRDMQALRKAMAKAKPLGLANLYTERAEVTLTQLLEEINQQRAAAAAAAVSDEDEDDGEADPYEGRVAKARAPEYDIKNFGNLRTPDDFARGVLLNKKKVMDGMLKFVNTPISKSLTRLDSERSDQAVKMHRSLLAYTGDKPLAFPASLATDTLAKATETPILRDEAYMQIIKHCTNNPSKQSEIRGWHLMSMTAYTFPPSTEMIPYVVHFFLGRQNDPDESIRQMVEFCLLKVGRSRADQVCVVPDVEDVEAYATRPPSIITIEAYSPPADPTVFATDLPVAPGIDTDAIMMLCSRQAGINMERKSLFGIYASYDAPEGGTLMRWVPDVAFIGDLFRPAVLQRYGRPHKFYLKRKLLSAAPDFPIADESEEESNALQHLTFLQVAADVVTSKLPLAESDTVAEFAAMHLLTTAVVPAGDARAVRTLGGMECVQSTWRSLMSTEDWCSLIASKISEYANMSDEDIEARYVNSLREHPLFGMHQFILTKNNTSELASVLPQKALLCIDSESMKFIDPADPMKEVILSVPTVAVVSCTAKNQIVHLKLRVSLTAQATLPQNVRAKMMHELEFQTPLADELAMMLAAK